MGGTCVDDSDGWVNNGVHRLARGAIGQAEDRDVAGVDGFGATPGILALRRGKRDEFQIGPAAKPFVNLQPGGALVAVDENKGRAHARDTPVTGNKWNEPVIFRAAPE
jgi:hypothetical protein